MQSNDPIPISIEVAISDMISGVFEINGSLTILPDRLVLRYAGVGLTGRVRDRSEVDLGHDDVRDVVLKERPWGLRVVIHPKRLSAFADLPGESHDRVVLRAKRRYRAHLRQALVKFTEELRDREEYDIPGIPFSLPDVGVAEVKGVLYLESDYLMLEVVSGLPGVTRSRTRRVEVAIEAIGHIRFEKGLRKDSIFLDCGEELLDVIPGRHAGELRMRVSRRHRPDASLLVKVVEERGWSGDSRSFRS
jgi:hypothetical protein